MVPGSSYGACIGALNAKGRYLSGNPRFTVMLRCPFTTWFSDKTAKFAFAKESVQELIDLREMIESGTLKPIVDKIYPLEDAATAHSRVEAEQRTGAVVLSLEASASNSSVTG
jgi:NADPH:quinone reductase-like Zn-dependent oxidoreductase